MGYAHPDHLLASLTSYQLSEWYAYGGIEPFGPLQEDFRAGQICATVANYAGMQRSPKIGQARADEFMPALNQGQGASSKVQEKDDGVLLADPEAQSSLIKQAIFGI